MQEPTLKDHIGYWINRLRMEVHQAFEARLAAYDVSIAQWCILASLYGRKGESITELAAYIEVDKASISRVVERMKEKGHVTHKAGKDRRSGRVRLTREGVSLVPQLFCEAAENERHFFGHLSEEEQEQFRKIFCRIFAAIPAIWQEGWLIHKGGENMAHPITELWHQAHESSWSFPKLFDELKNKGVASYDVDVGAHRLIYHGNFGMHEERAPADFRPFSIREKFDEAAIKHALQRRQQKETTYIGFLHDIADAGVARYHVDMQAREVIYHGKRESDVYVQAVPRQA